MARDNSEALFKLDDGTPCFYGDILYHPDRRRVGWYCVAEFPAKPDSDMVTVRSDCGAVPVVFISELRRGPPIEVRCERCGQLLPKMSE